jgi:D-tyrosyl-tRNA(Tyr) deacylase
MAERLLGYRVFADASRPDEPLAGRHRWRPVAGQPVHPGRRHGRSGMRPSFTTAAPPDDARRGFDRLVEVCRQRHPPGVETGRFGAHMVVSLVNDGPVTFLLRP